MKRRFVIIALGLVLLGLGVWAMDMIHGMVDARQALLLETALKEHAFTNGQWDMGRVKAFVLSHPDRQRWFRIGRRERVVGSEVMLFEFYINDGIPSEVRRDLDRWIAQNGPTIGYDKWRVNQRHLRK